MSVAARLGSRSATPDIRPRRSDGARRRIEPASHRAIFKYRQPATHDRSEFQRSLECEQVLIETVHCSAIGAGSADEHRARSVT